MRGEPSARHRTRPPGIHALVMARTINLGTPRNQVPTPDHSHWPAAIPSIIVAASLLVAVGTVLGPSSSWSRLLIAVGGGLAVVAASRHDDDWAGRALGALLADGAQHQSGESAMAARPDHQEIGVGGCVDQDLGGRALLHYRCDADAFGVDGGAGERCAQGLVGRLGERFVKPLER
ncbi:Uncharacterised protein [Mycobacteroides abscessus]|nr:Uncharacterised protein [Mycobacteroides abscessus]CPU63256.1 Uncharacterised protein [Mycobacteroides abscessus]SKK67816.1 Uncharacterised protein [Mycobacteroides abscessus subsp. massiliense]SKQ42476.1 Uncharacterised protein [Mycobacteroides abscessus subsp. massiliense]SKW98997.1 Uncharacterised protein [Mycobacteroides abscessus subsp. massiliense]